MAQKKKRGRPRSRSPIRSASFRLPEELLELLDAEAEAQERSKTTLVRRALQEYLKRQQQQQ